MRFFPALALLAVSLVAFQARADWRHIQDRAIPEVHCGALVDQEGRFETTGYLLFEWLYGWVAGQPNLYPFNRAGVPTANFPAFAAYCEAHPKALLMEAFRETLGKPVRPATETAGTDPLTLLPEPPPGVLYLAAETITRADCRTLGWTPEVLSFGLDRAEVAGLVNRSRVVALLFRLQGFRAGLKATAHTAGDAEKLEAGNQVLAACEAGDGRRLVEILASD